MRGCVQLCYSEILGVFYPASLPSELGAGTAFLSAALVRERVSSLHLLQAARDKGVIYLPHPCLRLTVEEEWGQLSHTRSQLWGWLSTSTNKAAQGKEVQGPLS